MSQILTSPPRCACPPPAARSRPSGENATARAMSARPSKVATVRPESASVRETPPWRPVARIRPSGWKATENTCGLTGTAGSILGNRPTSIWTGTSCGLGPGAPASIHRRINSMSAGPRGSAENGIRGSILPETIRYRGLCSLFPGTTAGPRWPPCSMVSIVSRTSPPILVVAEWQAMQLRARIGAIAAV